jgi:hypothetical protein
VRTVALIAKRELFAYVRARRLDHRRAPPLVDGIIFNAVAVGVGESPPRSSDFFLYAGGMTRSRDLLSMADRRGAAERNLTLSPRR